MGSSQGAIAKPECSHQFEQALEELQRVCQGVVIYGLDHPAVTQAASVAVAALQRAGGLHLLSRGTGLRIGDAPVRITSANELLRDRIVALRISALVIRGTVEHADTIAFARAVGLAKSDHRWTAADAQDLSHATEGRIEAIPISYSGVAVREGAGHAQSNLELDWSWVSQDLLRVAEGSGGITAAELAARVNSSLDAELSGLPTQVIEAAAESLKGADPARRAAAEARLTMFFSLLGNNVLQASARIDATHPSRSMQAMFEVAGVMSPAPIVEGLEQIETSVLGTPDGIRLLAKLVWISQDQQRLSERLSGVLASLRDILAPLQEETNELADAVKVLEEAVQGQDFATEDYEDLLARVENAQEPQPQRSAEAWSWSPETARVHAAAIAVDLLTDASTPVENLEGAFSYLAGHIESVVDAGAVDIAFESASAVAMAGQRQLPGSAMAACASLAQTLCAPAIIAKLLVQTRAKGLADQCVCHMVAQCGIGSMLPLLQKSAIGKIDLDPSLLVNDPAVASRDLASELFRVDQQTLEKLAADKMIEPERRARLAHAMLAIDDPARRAVAYRVFDELYPQWPRSLVAHALMDDHPPICAMAIVHLDDDASNLHSVGVMLSGGLGFTPDGALFRAGILALARLNAAAVLAHVAALLARSPSPRNLRRAWQCWRLSVKCKGKRA